MLGMERAAVVSEDGRYRYSLSRQWDAGANRLLWIMLNPSTADALVDDPTIRRCIGFARGFGFGGIEVVNLFAYRATNPKALAALDRETAIGPENRSTIAAALDRAYRTNSSAVAAWGASWRTSGHSRLTVELLADELGVPLFCLGTTKDNDPRHPLYVSSREQLWPWVGES